MAQRQLLRSIASMASCQMRCASSLMRRYASSPAVHQHYFPSPLRVSVSSIHTSVPHFNEHIFNIQDEADFKTRVLDSQTPVIVDFHASWCGPCKLLGPRLEMMVGNKKGEVLLAKVDIDDHSDLAIDHGVEAVPTVIGIKNGTIQERFIGLKDDPELESFIKKLTD